MIYILQYINVKKKKKKKKILTIIHQDNVITMYTLYII